MASTRSNSNGTAGTQGATGGTTAANRARSALKTARQEATTPRIGAALGIGALAAAVGYFASPTRREKAVTGAKDLYGRARSRVAPSRPEAAAANSSIAVGA